MAMSPENPLAKFSKYRNLSNAEIARYMKVLRELKTCTKSVYDNQFRLELFINGDRELEVITFFNGWRSL